MKQLLLLLSSLWLATAPVRAQDPVLQAYSDISTATLQKVVESYYKTLPYSQSFSRFLKRLMDDPDLQAKEFNRRTDSTFFYTSGTYQRYNPFLYRPTTVKVIVAETEFSDSDTSSYRDTIVYYQLLVTADTSRGGEGFVKREYNRLLRKTSQKFTHSTQALGSANGVTQGALTRCFIEPFAVCPLTFAWGRNEGSRAYVFSISLAMKVQENKAGMITLPGEPVRNTSQRTWLYEKQ